MFSDSQKFIVEGEKKEHFLDAVGLMFAIDGHIKHLAFTFCEEEDGSPFVLLSHKSYDNEGATPFPTKNIELVKELLWDFILQQTETLKEKVQPRNIDGGVDTGWSVEYKDNDWKHFASIRPKYFYYGK